MDGSGGHPVVIAGYLILEDMNPGGGNIKSPAAQVKLEVISNGECINVQSKADIERQRPSLSVRHGHGS